MKRVTIVIVSYNTKPLLLACLKSIYAQTRTDWAEIMVVDNASSDGSAQAVRDDFPQVVLHAMEHNLGFAAANNMALREVATPYVFLLNPDTEAIHSAIEKLLDIADNDPVSGIWGPQTIFADGTLNPYNCHRRISVWGTFCETSGASVILPDSALFNHSQYGGWMREETRAVDVISGCAFLIRTDLWRDLGGFDARYFMYGEEHDLCLRARSLGARPLVCHNAQIIHHQARSYPHRADMWAHLLRAKITLAREHVPGLRGWLTITLFRAFPLGRRIAFGLVSRIKGGRAIDQARTWAEVWARRSEWRDGY